MTDKELKKLSRLELLELLLHESRENEKLKEDIIQLKKENSLEKTVLHISDTSKQIEEILNNAKNLTDTLNSFSSECHSDTQRPCANTVKKTKNKSKDVEIYERLLLFFYQNPYTISVLSDDLQEDIQKRINEIISKQK